MKTVKGRVRIVVAIEIRVSLKNERAEARKGQETKGSKGGGEEGELTAKQLVRRPVGKWWEPRQQTTS